MFDWLLNVVYADGAATAAAGAEGTPNMAGALGASLLPMIGIFVIMYLILILPQKRREKKTREMINSAVNGDKVVTIGGISGRIVNVKDDEFTIETSIERTKINVKKWAVKEVIKPVQA